MALTKLQLEEDVRFLAMRAQRAGGYYADGKRDWGTSSNSLVALAYGVGKQAMPSDWADYAACVRAIRHLPKHRVTARILDALRSAKSAVEFKYPAAERRAYFHRRRAA